MTHDYSFYEQILREIEYKEYESRIAACSGNHYPEKRFNPCHDDKGRFAKAPESPSKPLTSPKSCGKLDKKGKPFEYPAAKVSKTEYACFIRNVNTYYYTKYKGKKICWYNSGELGITFKFENHGFDDYNIFEVY